MALVRLRTQSYNQSFTAILGSLGLIICAVIPPSTVQAVNTIPPVSANSRYGVALGSQIQYLSTAEQEAQLTDIAATGTHWVRLDLKWNEIQYNNATTYDWSRYDTLYAEAMSRGLQVLVLIVGAPPWARNPSCASIGDTCAPSDPTLFGTFARQAALHYGPMGIHYWEIWNEENTTTFWAPAPNPSTYTALLKAGYSGIKAADPNAYVVSGGLASVSTYQTTNISPTDFLAAMYQAGAHGAFDALGDHPYCWAQATCPNDVSNYDPASGWSMMADTPISLRSLMTVNGDSAKPIWATEFGAPTGGGTLAKTEAQQATMLTNSYKLYASYSWSGPLFWYSYQDYPNDPTNTETYFGLIRPDGSDKPAYAALKASIAAATITASSSPSSVSLPGDLNNDKLVNAVDLSIMLTRWGTSDAVADINKDGHVNIFDLSILLTHWSS